MIQTLTNQTFGAFLDEIPLSQENLTLNFSPASAPQRRQRWSNYGLSADFLGDYFAAFFLGEAVPDSKINRKDTVKATVSYIANELLENAVKYSLNEATTPSISITLYLYEQKIILQVTNYADRPTVEKYQGFVQELLNSDVDELYIRQLEKTASGEGESNMGLLTMINDYSARFGWKFETLANDTTAVRVAVMVHLEV